MPIPRRLGQLEGLKREPIGEYARLAMLDHCHATNPRPCSQAEMEELLGTRVVMFDEDCNHVRRPRHDAVRPALAIHAEELREVARTLGLAYEEGEVKDSRGLHPGAPLFERWVLCENRLSGTIDGAPAAMFDLMTIEGTGEGERRRSWTVILFAQSRLPFFVCVPRGGPRGPSGRPSRRSTSIRGQRTSGPVRPSPPLRNSTSWV